MLESVTLPRTSELLAEQLRRRIFDGSLRPGEPLPTERALAEQSGHGRSSIREALRTLEAEGLIATRPGRGGGATVCEPPLSSVARSIDVFVRGRHVRYQHVLEARQILEPGAAALAALRRRPDELRAIEQDHEAMVAAHQDADVDAFVEANLAWHLDLNRATGNELIISLMLGLSNTLRAAIDLEDFNTAELRTETMRAHGRILDAVRAGDGAAAQRRMARHLHAHEDVFLARFGDATIPLPDVDAKGRS